MDDIQKRYIKNQNEIQTKALNASKDIIEKFKAKCSKKGIKLTDKNFTYIDTTGVVAKYPNILLILCDELKLDKDELAESKLLESIFTKKQSLSGYYFNDDYMVMASPYFRRMFHELNNYAPHFIGLYWNQRFNNIESYISLDLDRVRINVNDSRYMEFDTWYGAPFDESIAEIPDGVAKLRPPLDIEQDYLSFIFSDSYSLDVKWESKGKIKTFQAEEFKNEDVTWDIDGEVFFPARYIHSEYDLNLKNFRHFDGAIHFYTEEEYYLRRDSDFNYNLKKQNQIKARSKKLFKFNGIIKTPFWVEFSSHFFTGNPLLYEYFSGHYPESVEEALIRIRNLNS